MIDGILKEMKCRGAFHCVLAIQVNGEVLAAGSDVLYFNDHKNFEEWRDLQPVIHGEDTDISIFAIHRL